MSWFFIALAAPFLWSLVNIIDKYLIAKYIKKQSGFGGLTIFTSLIGIPAALLIGLFTVGIFQVNILDKVLLLGVGGIMVVWVYLYFLALDIEDVSTVALWFLTIPIFGYILGYIFLGETLSFQQIIGSLIILFGLFLISVNWNGHNNKFKWKFLAYILGSCFLIAVTSVIFKYVAVIDSFWVSSFWQYLGLSVFGILVYCFIPRYRREFKSMVKNRGKNIFALTAIGEIFNIGGNLFSNYALLLAPVALVCIVDSFQPAIIFLITIFCTFFLPNIVKENLNKRALLLKAINIVIMLIGSVVLFV